MDKYVFGIDLGTTYSCIAYVDETGKSNTIKNSEGDYITPSVVNFASASQVVVGQIAKENSVIDPVNTVSLVKAKMGKTNFVIKYNGKDKTPEEVSSYILRKVTEDAASQIHSEVKDVVITCPAYFGTTERVATKNAGIIAGLNVLGIISEPVAAAIYYGCTEEHEEKTILVYDLGGGTFDVTVMKISSEKIQVICSEGDHDLGGKDWDAALMRYLVSEFNSQTGCSDDFDEVAKQALQLKTETAKKQLTAKDSVPVVIDSAGKVARVNVSRETFDEITSTLLRSTLDITDAAISVAQKKYPGLKIDEILLVGGSTRMKQVERSLTEKYSIQPKQLDQDEAVAKGAAIYATNIQRNNKKYNVIGEFGEFEEEPVSIGGPKEQKTMPIEIVHATTKSFAVETMFNKVEPKCCNIIFKNMEMPKGKITISRIFGTLCANQSAVDIVVYESDVTDEFFDVVPDFVIGSVELEMPPNLPADSPLEITFSLNTDGILEVTGKDLTGNKEVHAIMKSKNIMSEETVKELINDTRTIKVL